MPDRVENLRRLSETKLSKKSTSYLVYKPLFRDLQTAVNKFAKGRLIDIGCGNKPYEKIFKDKISEYIGCDIMQSDLQKVDIICEANHIPLPDCNFDTAFSTQAIEHVSDYQGLVSEAYRLLKQGGYFILSAPLYWHLHEEPHDFFRFTKYGLEYVLQKAGFEVIEILPNGGMWAICGQVYLHAMENSKSNRVLLKCWRFLFFRFKLYWVVNVIFERLDKIDYNPINTMNYVIVAKKV
jgi:SAM-dependent methyltransferase